MKNDNENGLDELDRLIIQAVKKAAIKDILRDAERRLKRRKKLITISAIFLSLTSVVILFFDLSIWVKMPIITLALILWTIRFTRYR